MMARRRSLSSKLPAGALAGLALMVLSALGAALTDQSEGSAEIPSTGRGGAASGTCPAWATGAAPMKTPRAG